MKKSIVIKSLIYRFVESVLVKGLGLIISIVLARLLTPTEFGQVAILTVFINISITFVESGLGSALIQSKTVDSSDYSTAFWISLPISCFFVLLLLVAAPWIAWFYKDESLIVPLRIFALPLITDGLNSIQLAKIHREMRFKETMYRSTLVTLLSGLIGVVLAFNGFGIWALIGYNLLQRLLYCVALFSITHWLPQFSFSSTRAKELYSYGWKIMISALSAVLYNDIRALIIGKRYSQADLAFYNRGQQIPEVISGNMDKALQSVMFPVLSTAQDQLERIRRMLKKTISMGAFVIFPCMFGLSAVAPALVSVLLTDKWAPCVPMMQAICIGQACIPITSSNLVALKAYGLSAVMMKAEITRRVIMLMLLIATIIIFDSVLAIAISFTVAAWIDAVFVIWISRKHLQFGFKEHIASIWRPLLAALIMYACVVAVADVIVSVWIELVLQIAIGVAAYFLVCLMLKDDNLLQIKSICLQYLRGKA